MKCPQCGFENYNGSHFCRHCGAPLPYSAPDPQPQQQERSAGTKFIVAVLKALAYLAVFLLSQFAVSAAYGVYLSFTYTLRNGVQNLDPGEMQQELQALMADNMQLVVILSGLITFAVISLVFVLRGKQPLEEMSIRRVPVWELVCGFALGLMLNPAVSLIFSMIPFPQSLIENYDTGMDLLFGGPLWMEIISVVIVTPFIEEVVFRGLVFTRLRKGMSEVIAFILACVIFGAAHGHVISFLYASLLCIVLLAAFRKHESILLSFAIHMGFNGGNYLVRFLPENELILFAALFVCLAASVALVYVLLIRNKQRDEDEELKG